MTTKPENVRIALPSDEDAIFSLMYLAHKENGMGTMNPVKVWEKIRLATRQRGGVIGVIDGKDGLEACIYLILSQWWYSDDWHLEELKNFVHPAHRKTTHAKQLLEFSKWFAEQMSVNLPEKIPLFVGILTTHRVEAKVRLYHRQFAQGGAVFHHNMPDGYLSR